MLWTRLGSGHRWTTPDCWETRELKRVIACIFRQTTGRRLAVRWLRHLRHGRRHGLFRVHDKKVMSHAALGSDLRSQKS